MPTYFNNKQSVFADPEKEIFISPGTTYFSEFYFDDPDLQLISRSPYWEPIVASQIVTGAAGATAQVDGLGASDYITFIPEDEMKIYFNSMDLTPLHTSRYCTIYTNNRVDVVVLEFVNAGTCEVHGVKSSMEFV